MNSWTAEELDKLGRAEEVELAAVGADGSLRTPVIIWAVRHGDALYVRSYRGEGGAWYKAANHSREGRVKGGGVEKEVIFLDAEPEVQGRIDEAYQSKYKHYPTYVRPMLAAQAQAATLKIVPKSN